MSRINHMHRKFGNAMRAAHGSWGCPPQPYARHRAVIWMNRIKDAGFPMPRVFLSRGIL